MVPRVGDGDPSFPLHPGWNIPTWFKYLNLGGNI